MTHQWQLDKSLQIKTKYINYLNYPIKLIHFEKTIVF